MHRSILNILYAKLPPNLKTELQLMEKDKRRLRVLLTLEIEEELSIFRIKHDLTSNCSTIPFLSY